MNTEDYFKRIKYFGKKEATLDVLKELCWHHVCHVPFDTISLHSGSRRVMKVESLYQSIVNNNRGGFCFELNGLFHWLLQQMGFNAVILQAQAYMDGKFNADYGHLTIMVIFENSERWIVDVAVLPNPINLDAQGNQIAKHSLYKITTNLNDSYYYLQKFKRHTVAKTEGRPDEMEQKLKRLVKAHTNDGLQPDESAFCWEHKFRFHTVPVRLSEFQGMMDFHQQSEESEFAHNSFCVLHNDTGYIALWGKTLVRKHYLNEFTEVVCASHQENNEELREILKRLFNVQTQADLNLHGRDIGRLLQ